MMTRADRTAFRLEEIPWIYKPGYKQCFSTDTQNSEVRDEKHKTTRRFAIHSAKRK